MTALAPEPKTNELLDSLMEAISSNTVLSEFEVAYYKREAEKLSSPDHTHLILTLLYTSLRQQKQTLIHAQEALRLSQGDRAVHCNVIWALSFVGAAKSVYNLIIDLPIEHSSVAIVENIASASDFYNNFDFTERVISHIDDPASDTFQIVSRHLKLKKKLLTFAVKNFGVTEENLRAISLLAAEVLEEQDIASPVNSLLHVLPESEQLDVIFEVAGKPEAIFDLNWALSEKLVEHDLVSNGIVARFDVSQNKRQLIVGGTA
ncbi:hypothetical protein L3Q72_09920 [Vibrio sp. JC009]|uniref:hypothetical protein n=1 Tax=Vibrio sp. JC009 TaxID=2912314 RepID=UPI0023B007B3|nr:hypothetical protein [Vibrio sp. JC009]WED20955.1 hypothetical protein L3Q72_09920 [Vibrio sp. JC009]